MFRSIISNHQTFSVSFRLYADGVFSTINSAGNAVGNAVRLDWEVA